MLQCLLSQRYRCVQCGGGAICEHGRRRTVCKECVGSGVCQHDKLRYRCKECGGGSICEHGRHRFQCRICNWAHWDKKRKGERRIRLEAVAVEEGDHGAAELTSMLAAPASVTELACELAMRKVKVKLAGQRWRTM